jgi:hypothetical protein
MKTIDKIEKDCLYMWINNPNTPTNECDYPTLKDLIIGETVVSTLLDTGSVKLKKFFERNVKLERSVAYKQETVFSKEENSKWFIISQKPINKIRNCKEFYKITFLKQNYFHKINRKQAFTKNCFYYVVIF